MYGYGEGALEDPQQAERLLGQARAGGHKDAGGIVDRAHSAHARKADRPAQFVAAAGDRHHTLRSSSAA